MNSDHVDVNSDHVDVNLDRDFYRSSPELSGEERDRVREVARDLLARLRAMFTLDWQKTAQARAREAGRHRAGAR